MLPPHASAQVEAILRADLRRWRVLDLVRTLDLPDCWIGAGFVRNAVWDHRHGRSPSPMTGDIDVIWFDPTRADPAEDRALVAILTGFEPSIAWSIKNQARMHIRNNDHPYASATDAMRYWPETATAVAARRHGIDGCEIAAPFGLDDLLSLTLRPALHFCGAKRHICDDRLRTKGWLANWPLLRLPET